MTGWSNIIRYDQPSWCETLVGPGWPTINPIPSTFTGPLAVPHSFLFRAPTATMFFLVFNMIPSGKLT